MPSEVREHRSRHVVSAVLNAQWLILPEKLEEIVAFLEARAIGLDLSARFGERVNDEPKGPTILPGGIQVINVDGTLAPRMNMMTRISGGTSTEVLRDQINAAARDDSVNTVILKVDSPGGAAAGTYEVSQAIRELGKVKRVVTSASNMMASAAYWMGSAAQAVYASPSAEVGSVGVYNVVANMKEHYEKEGVKFEVMRAGALKAAGNEYEALTDERRASLQGRIDAIYDQFVGSVAENRNVSVAKVLESFGQGNVFLADEAMARGMIDGVATFEQVLAREQERLASASKRTFSIRVTENQSMSSKLKAAMFAKGLLASLDVDDATCTAALNAYRIAIGVNADATEDHLIEKIMSTAKPDVVSTAIVETKTIPAAPPAANVAAEERARVLDLQARGRLLKIDAAAVDQAITGGINVGDALDQWTRSMTTAHPPIVPGDSQDDKFAAAAGALLCQRYSTSCGPLSDQEQAAIRNYGSSLRHKKVMDLVRVQLASRGYRSEGDDRADAQFYLKNCDIMAADGGGDMQSLNRRGDHADALSALINKSLNRGAIVANTSYQRYSTQIADLVDFKPKSFIDHGIFNGLDAIQEDEQMKQLKFQSELQTWIKADRYANCVGLTEEMLVDDDLSMFSQDLRSLTIASRFTVQRNVIGLLVANPVMLDGNAFFSSAHKNIVTAGGPPSATELDKMRKLHRLNNSFGTDAPMGSTLDAIIVPAALETVAIQTVASGFEIKTPQTDATVNVFRGIVDPIVDPYLDAYNAVGWYSKIPKEEGSGVIYAFQRGFGESGMRNEWYDASRKTRYVGIETRFGVALANWRAMVFNDGTA